MTATIRLRESVRYVALAFLVAALFFIFAMLAVAMRPLMIAVVVLAAIAAAVLYRFSPRFRDWFESAGEQQVSYKGLHLATDVAVDPRHSWARIKGRNAEVGIDDVMESTLGPVESVTLPRVGTRVEQGERLFSVRRGDRYVDVQAPLSGKIVGTNEQLLQAPELVNQDPYGRGWAVRIQPDRLQEDTLRLRSGKAARGWFHDEIDRMLMSVFSHGSMAPALQDGGVVVNDVYREIDDRGWEQLTATFFGMGASSGM
jgi:glycine cleavage system H protein